MATKKTKTEKIEYYYTWKGIDSTYKSSRAAQNTINEKGLKQIWPVGFEYEKEAEAFCKGELDKYIQDNYKAFEATQYDAVIYTDGSHTKNNKMVSYGLIIFFRDETDPYIESGTLEDVDVVKYKNVRYDRYGNEMKDGDNIKEIAGINEKGNKKAEKGFVAASRNMAAEFFGAMRALEICCQKRELKKLLIIYDCEDIKAGYEDRDNIGNAKGYAAVAYRKLLQNLKDIDLQFIKVDSHSDKNENEHQYPIDADEYLHAVYNDLVDILARAELGIKIKPRWNFNAFRVISDEFQGFYYAGADTTEKRRKHARDLVKDVLNKSDGIYRPIFSKV